MKRAFLIAATLLGLFVWVAGPAGANHGRRRSSAWGPINGNGAEAAILNGYSNDGTKVWFTSEEPLVAGDTDTLADIYERAGGVTTQISVGPNGYNGQYVAAFKGASEDGSHVFMQTNEPLVASDTDATAVSRTSRPVPATTSTSTRTAPRRSYRAAGTGRSTSPSAATRRMASRVFFRTEEHLTPSDTDDEGDITSVRRQHDALTTGRAAHGRGQMLLGAEEHAAAIRRVAAEGDVERPVPPPDTSVVVPFEYS